MAATIDLLRQDHRNLAKLLKALERQVLLFEDGEEADLDIVKAVLDYCLTYPDLCHHPKEDVVLRRLTVRAPEAAVRVGDLQAEHETLSASTRRFATALHHLTHSAVRPQDWFGRAARSFLESYWQHMELEETVFFPLALRELNDEDWALVDAEVEQLSDPLFGGLAEERFKVLRNEILLWVEAEPRGDA